MSFWFAPTEPLNLGLCRALLFGGLFVKYAILDPLNIDRWAAVSPAFWVPESYFAALRIPLFSAQTLRGIELAWKVSLLFGAAGFLTLPAAVAAWLLSMYILALPRQFAGMFHGYRSPMPILILGLMAASRCGDAFSADSFLRRRRRNSSSASAAKPCGEYLWPVRAAQIGLALVFFEAGISKLRHTGISWIWSSAISQTIALNYSIDPAWRNGLGFYVAKHTLLLHALQALVLGVELAYPLLIFSRRLRWFFVPAGFLFLAGVRIILGFEFDALMICTLFWIPWDRVARVLSRPVVSGIGQN